jgi:hypothetical protein
MDFFHNFLRRLPERKGNGEMADNLAVLTKSLEWQIPTKLQGVVNGESGENEE